MKQNRRKRINNFKASDYPTKYNDIKPLFLSLSQFNQLKKKINKQLNGR